MSCVFELSYERGLADNHQLQFYDVAQALWGFERAITITSHLLLNGKVITQSPSAKGFYVLAEPPEEGSWKIKAVLGAGSIVGAFGLAPPDTQFGWLAKSAVEYIIEESLGFTPNFDETLGAQIKKYKSIEGSRSLPDDLSQSRFDAVIEKCEGGLRAMHRPIVFSGSAEVAQIRYKVGADTGALRGHLDSETYEYVSKTVTSDDIEKICGVVSSYNINTFKGRIYLPEENRTIPFELSRDSRVPGFIDLVTSSLRANAAIMNVRANRVEPDICLTGFRNESSSGRLKNVFVTHVSGCS